jgi:RNA polymerase sigma-70 factor (ECF subfamily)
MDRENNKEESHIATEGRFGRTAGSGSSSLSLLDDLYRHHKPLIVRMLRRHVGTAEAAENLFHEACRVAAERLSRSAIQDPSRLAGFVYGTARRIARAEQRKAAARRTDSVPELVDAASDDRPAPDTNSNRVQLGELVRQLLQELAVERDRRLLVRLYLDEADKAEICRELALSEEHFNRVLFRAKLRFREILEQHGYSDISRLLIFLLLAGAALVQVGQLRF